jgi:hypothetical protein
MNYDIQNMELLGLYQGRIQDLKLGGGAYLKKLRRAEGGANFFGVFRVKNHDFTPTNHIPPPESAPVYSNTFVFCVCTDFQKLINELFI